MRTPQDAKAVIYARYSSDKQRESSIEDQVRNCEAFPGPWEIVACYTDQAVSGATHSRPEYQRMLAAAEGGEFHILLVDELSRLGRDQVEREQAIRRLEFWGVRLIGVTDGYDSTSPNTQRKITRGVRGLFDELYLDELGEKTHRGLTGLALAGNNAGGRTYGYRHVPTYHPTKTDTYGRPVVEAVRRAIDPDQAAVVRRIFEMYADGHSPRAIASRLNEERIPSPRGRAWAASAISGDQKRPGVGILNNPLYIGQYIWNRSQWVRDPDTRKRKRRERPSADWIIQDMPELRIIDQSLWNRVKDRQKEQRERVRAAQSKNGSRRAGPGRRPRYLFSGLLRCGVCGGTYVIVNSYQYGCSRHKESGAPVCANSIRVPRRLLEQCLLAAIREELCSDEAFALFRAETTRLLREMRRRMPDHSAKLRNIEGRIENMVEAIQAGAFSPALKQALEAAEREREALQAVAAEPASELPELLPQAWERFQALTREMENLGEEDIPRIRTQLQALLGEINLVPAEGGKYLNAQLTGNYAGLLGLTESKINVVAGAGFEPTTFGL